MTAQPFRCGCGRTFQDLGILSAHLDICTDRPAEYGDRVRLTYGDGSFVEGELAEVLILDDGTIHRHTRGQVRRDVIPGRRA